MVAVNFFGAAGVITGLRGLMRLSRAPRAVAISSSASILPSDAELVRLCLAGDEAAARRYADGHPLAYASSKLALSHWIRRTSITPGWADAGVLLNGVAPGQVRTPMIAPMLETAAGQALLAQSAPFAVPDPASADDIAPLLAFLAGPDNRYMVGQVVFCDGGKDVLVRGEAGGLPVVSPQPAG
jgi:NAD(P)-dependent dehydrogenase (short-subunit alcohol dehydrogenase family)